MKNKYEMNCGDEFRVVGEDKQEVATMTAWHFMMKHPKEKISMGDAMGKVMMAKEM